MTLVFADGATRQCASERVVHGMKLRCPVMTSRTVTVPTGLHYYDGRLDYSESKLKETIPICREHEIQLGKSLAELNNAG